MPSIVVRGRTYPCTSTLAIGRKPGCDIVLEPRPGHHVVALHAHVVIDDAGAASFRDLSDDGSYVNGEWVCNRSVPLRDGDRIGIGAHELVFVV